MRLSILRYYQETCRKMLALGLVSLPRFQVEFNALNREIKQDTRRFPATRVFENIDQPSELFRRRLRIMVWRLGAHRRTRRRAPMNRRRNSPANSASLPPRSPSDPSPRIARLGPGPAARGLAGVWFPRRQSGLPHALARHSGRGGRKYSARRACPPNPLPGAHRVNPENAV